MRVIGGKLRGRRLPASVPRGTRPTTDRAREGLASALQARDLFADARVLDLFAGSGALGFEAISRGAREVLAVDVGSAALRAVAENARALGLGAHTRTLRVDLLGDPASVAARIAAAIDTGRSLVFVDPPFADAAKLGPLLSALLDAGVLLPTAAVVLEHSHGDEITTPAGFELLQQYRYGDSAVRLLAPARFTEAEES